MSPASRARSRSGAAVPADVPRISELISELADYERSADQVSATAEDLRAALFAPQPALFGHVAVADDEVVGFALWFLNYSTWLGKHGIYLEDLYVTPDLRGRGAGKALLADARVDLRASAATAGWSGGCSTGTPRRSASTSRSARSRCRSGPCTG